MTLTSGKDEFEKLLPSEQEKLLALLARKHEQLARPLGRPKMSAVGIQRRRARKSAREKALNEFEQKLEGEDIGTLIAQEIRIATRRRKAARLRPASQETEEKAVKALYLKTQGYTWDEIGKELGYTPGKGRAGAIHKLVQRFLEFAAETTDEDKNITREIHHRRHEMMWKAMLPKISQGQTRAVEVAVKLLQRDSELLGLDRKDESKGVQNVPVTINVTAHPEDDRARAFLAEVQGRPGPRAVLPPPIEGTLLEEEGDSSGGGDRSGQNLVRALLDSTETSESGS
jgi:hypothetical protein